MTIEILANLIAILTVLIGGSLLAKSYFKKAKVTKVEQDAYKKNASNHNKELDTALSKKDEKAYSDLLHAKATRFQPKIPYRIDGSGEVMKKVKSQMEAVSGPTSVLQKSEEIYKEALVVVYNYMTDGKLGDKFVEGSGKVTRIWVNTDGGWRLVHEHVSEN